MSPHVFILLALQAAQGSSSADTLAKARAQAKSLEFAAALATSHDALEQGDATPQLAAEIHQFSGEMAAALGDRELARSEFSRALVLDPKLQLGPSASPRLREPFEDARTQLGQHALKVKAVSTHGAGGRVTTEITPTSDVFSMVAGARLYLEENGRWSVAPGPVSAMEKEWSCAAGGCRYYVAAVDKFGNELAFAGTAREPLVLEKPTLVPDERAASDATTVTETPSKPFYLRPGPYLTAAALICAGLAVWFGVSFSNEQNQLQQIEANRAAHLMSEAVSVDNARQRDHTLMFVASGAAVIAAAGAFFTW